MTKNRRYLRALPSRSSVDPPSGSGRRYWRSPRSFQKIRSSRLGWWRHPIEQAAHSLLSRPSDTVAGSGLHSERSRRGPDHPAQALPRDDTNRALAQLPGTWSAARGSAPPQDERQRRPSRDRIDDLLLHLSPCSSVTSAKVNTAPAASPPGPRIGAELAETQIGFP
jgi:hypothetical protein